MKILTTTALATLIAAGLASGASAEIRIGATISETGPAAFLGDPEAKTLKMLVDKVVIGRLRPPFLAAADLRESV